MLVALSIRDVILIDKLDLTFSGGLTVFTGETGAGKSIILDSLSLALGARGDVGFVRKGAASASVTAAFELKPFHPASSLLRDHDFDDTGTLILRRVQFADGRTKATINDRPVTGALHRQIGRMLAEFHGQHDDRALLDPASHRQLLDQFGGLTEDVEAVSALWHRWRELEAEAEALAANLDKAAREADYLSAACAELDEIAPQPGEEETLAATRQALLSSARLRGDLEAVADALFGQQFPLGKLNAALRRFERQPNLPQRLRPVIAAVERVLIEAEEARSLIEAELRAESKVDVEATEERLFKLRAIARKHRVAVNELPEVHRRFAQDLANIEMRAEKLEAARAATRAAVDAYAEKADTLSEKRLAAAAKLNRMVQRELKPLRLEKARFITHSERLAENQNGVFGGPFGRETIMFHVQTNPGTRPGPLTKIASGGELARFLLALKVALSEENTASVLVFDEIDTGVGGATASAVGERLGRLGRKAQVLAVTHSPQVAVFADAHYRLYKASRGSGDNAWIETCAEALDGGGRREEIARMLAGHTITEEARAAAERLIGAKHEAA